MVLRCLRRIYCFCCDLIFRQKNKKKSKAFIFTFTEHNSLSTTFFKYLNFI